MAAATASREVLEPLLGTQTGIVDHQTDQKPLDATVAFPSVGQTSPRVMCCAADKAAAAASTCILADGVQQADEQAAKKAR